MQATQPEELIINFAASWKAKTFWYKSLTTSTKKCKLTIIKVESLCFVALSVLRSELCDQISRV